MSIFRTMGNIIIYKITQTWKDKCHMGSLKCETNLNELNSKKWLLKPTVKKKEERDNKSERLVQGMRLQLERKSEFPCSSAHAPIYG